MDVQVIIPAAGIGQRMRGQGAKQYLPLHGRPMLQHTLERFLCHPQVSRIVVPLHPRDTEWPRLQLDEANLVTVTGGRERCQSVCKGLEHLKADNLADDAWVMVHDAARPCVTQVEISALIEAVSEHAVGGLLGIPVVDTIKQVEQGCVTKTVDRTLLWRALTPQMFRFGVLYTALRKAVMHDRLVSDEAMAVEALGYQPLMIEGSGRNIKVTYPQDMQLAEKYLQDMA